jgi:hypothetical protein
MFARRPHSDLSPAAAALALLGSAAAAGCAMPASDEATMGGGGETLYGQTVLFVGTDPATQQTDVYLLQATSPEGEAAPDLAHASQYTLTPLTALGTRAEGAPLQGENDSLFTDEVPFAVPDRDGSRVAFSSTAYDASGYSAGGRISVVRVPYGDVQTSADVPGLAAAWFTWSGDYLVLERWTENGSRELLSVPSDEVGNGEPSVIGPSDPMLDLSWVHPLRGGDEFLAQSWDFSTGETEAWIVDAATGDARLLTSALPESVEEARVSPDGRWLAATTYDPQTWLRGVAIFDLQSKSDPEPLRLLTPEQSECYWPAFSPTDDSGRLAFVCTRLYDGRPDLVLWDGADSMAAEPDVLTDSSQPAVFDGTMDGLVIRSRPQWEPRGGYLVFGASTMEDAYNGAGMTLFSLEPGGTGRPIFSSDEGSADWAHFSAATASRDLLVWDRGATGLEDSAGKHPIQVVPLDEEGAQPVGISLGADLRVAYPLFLGGNSMLYP